MNNKIIAVDFDGTIVVDKYPAIGPEQPFAFDTLKKLQGDGYRLILWTYRQGKKLEEAVAFCHKNGVDFYTINASFEGEVFDPQTQSRKIHADYFIDDRNVGGFPGGGEVYDIIKIKINFSIAEGQEVTYYTNKNRKKKASLLNKIFK